MFSLDLILKVVHGDVKNSWKNYFSCRYDGEIKHWDRCKSFDEGKGRGGMSLDNK